MLWEMVKVTWKKIFRTSTLSVIIISAYLFYCLYLIIVAGNPEEGVKSLVIFSLLAVLLSGGLGRDEFEFRQIDPFLSRFKISSLFWGKLTGVFALVFLAVAAVGLVALAGPVINREWPTAIRVLRISGRGLVQALYLSAAGFFLATWLRGIMNFASILVFQFLALYYSEKYLKMLEFIAAGGLDKFSLKGAAWLLLLPLWVRPVAWQMVLLLSASAGFILLAFLVFDSMARKKNMIFVPPDDPGVRLRLSGVKMTYPEGFFRRRGREALKGVDITVKAGKLTGFLGPNGAGKTTTLRIILDFLKPRAGRVEYSPAGANQDRLQKLKVGYLQEMAGLYPFLTVRETLNLVARNEGLGRQQSADLAVSLAEKLQLGEHLDRRIKNLSKGTVQKVAFAVATIGQPEFLVFDEPYTGLDPLIMYEIRNLILELKDRGATIFLSSHLLPEVEKVCDEVILINKGKIVWSGEIEKLKTAWRLYRAAQDNPGLVDRLNQLLGEDLSGQPFSFFAGLETGRLTEDPEVAAVLKDIPVPDIEKIFLDSVLNS
ncbi:MAG: ABC transporter ATP-binding protein [Candidatus Saccharicenans sp.]|nr:ABC transporter ATP-binding protein [Candidatus Saccharicenans sp.]